MILKLVDEVKRLVRQDDEGESEVLADDDEAKSRIVIDISRARNTLIKRKGELRRRRREMSGNPISGEERSEDVADADFIPVDRIKEDPTFVNTRVHEDSLRPDLSSNEGQKMEDLEQSMKDEGLKVPIIVVAGPSNTFFLRAGFRRTKVARKLGWKKILAVIYPADTPQRDEYWLNILENLVRKSLSTYESAMAAKIMRDKFDVSAADFSRKTGYSEGYVSKLLTCIDKLPDQLIEQWKFGAGLSFDEWYRLALMDPERAMKEFWRMTGQRPKDLMRDLTARRGDGRKMPPAWFAERMQRLYVGLEGSDVLEPRVRDLGLRIVEVCMGTRDTIKGVYEPRRRTEYARRAKLRAELRMPEMGEVAAEEPPEAKPPPHLDAENTDDDGTKD